MFRDFTLTFSPEVAEFVKEQYCSANNEILEYGSGGSTIFAASEGKTIITTESSASWLIELMGAYKEKNLRGNIIPIFSDIGQTKSFGYPANEEKWQEWPDYTLKAWRYCEDNMLFPQLVLIDGRFRVGCFLASCIKTTVPVRILFDDFEERKYYHLVKEVAEPNEIIAGRLAVFDIKPNMIGVNFLIDHVKYLFDAR